MNQQDNQFDELNSVKGLIMTLIVLGHNKFFYNEYMDIYNILYTFHVAGFLLFPFLFVAKPLEKNYILDKFIQYIVPFACYYLFCSVLFYIIFLRNDQSIYEWILNLLYGFLNANSQALDAASGYKMFWFLPTLFILVLCRSCYSSIKNKAKYLFSLCFLLLHLLAGELDSIEKSLPWGVVIVSYIFALGLIVELTYKDLNKKNTNIYFIVSLVIFSISVYLYTQTNVIMHLGDMEIYGITNLLNMLLNDVLILFGFFTILFGAKYLKKIRILTLVGKHSLLIYLNHALIFQFLYIGITKISILNEYHNNSKTLTIVITYFITLLLSIIVSKIIDKVFILKKAINPKSLNDWLPIRIKKN